MYVITYKLLDKRAVKKEKNKKDISILLIKDCYEECYSYIKMLNEVNVEKYIVPKIDFDSTNPKLIVNLQNAPFDNEDIIMDLVKDGQITRQQIEGYFNVKRKFRQYVNMRIITFDAPHIYMPLKERLDAFHIQLHNHTDSDWCLCIGRFSVLPLLLRQFQEAPAPSKAGKNDTGK